MIGAASRVGAEPDLLRSMLKTFIDALMSAETDALCGALYGARNRQLLRGGFAGFAEIGPATGCGRPLSTFHERRPT